MAKRKRNKAREFSPGGGISGGGATLEQLQTQLDYIESNFPAMARACANDPQRLAELRRDYLTAHRNYTNAIGIVLDENDPHVQELNQQMAAGQQQIEGLQIGEANIAQILTTLTAVVKTASSLLALVGA
jgi:hypothetical protein